MLGPCSTLSSKRIVNTGGHIRVFHSSHEISGPPQWTWGIFKVINIYLNNDFDFALSDWCPVCFKPWGIQWLPWNLSFYHERFLNEIKAVTASQKLHFSGIWILLSQCLHQSWSWSVRDIAQNIAYKNIYNYHALFFRFSFSWQKKGALWTQLFVVNSHTLRWPSSLGTQQAGHYCSHGTAGQPCPPGGPPRWRIPSHSQWGQGPLNKQVTGGLNKSPYI